MRALIELPVAVYGLLPLFTSRSGEEKKGGGSLKCQKNRFTPGQLSARRCVRAQIRPAFLTLLVFTLVLMFGGGVTYLAAIPGLAAESPLMNPISGAEESADMERLARALSKTSGSVADGVSESPDASGLSDTDAAVDAGLPGGEGAGGEGDVAGGTAAGASAAGASGLAPSLHQEGSALAQLPLLAPPPDRRAHLPALVPLVPHRRRALIPPLARPATRRAPLAQSGGSQPTTPAENTNSGSSTPVDTRYYPDGPEENGLSPEMEADIAAAINSQYTILFSWGQRAYECWEEYNALCMTDAYDERVAASRRISGNGLMYQCEVAYMQHFEPIGKACGLSGGGIYSCSRYAGNEEHMQAAWCGLISFFTELNNAWSRNTWHRDPTQDESEWRSKITMGSSGLPYYLEVYEANIDGARI